MCIDFDRDAAFPMLGIKHAVSKVKQSEVDEIIENPEKSAEIQGTVDGFKEVLTFLKEKKLPTVFYFETRTIKMISEQFPEFHKLLNQSFFEIGLHGYDHEDLKGEETGLPFEEEEERDIIFKAKRDLEDLFSVKVIGFRAPYMRITENTHNILTSLDFKYDSSIYVESEMGIKPYLINEKLAEFPVIKTPKESSMQGMYTYLWPLFEGKRRIKEIVENYLTLVRNTKTDGSYISINLHSWHFSYNVEENRYLSSKETKRNIDYLIRLISALEDNDSIQFSTPKSWLDKNSVENVSS